jgi:hypothetical protein
MTVCIYILDTPIVSERCEPQDAHKHLRRRYLQEFYKASTNSCRCNKKVFFAPVFSQDFYILAMLFPATGH